MNQTEVGGLYIAYQQAGEGPPLVFLHGALEDSRVWHRQLDGLADEFTVLAWDAPGCGQSSEPPESWRMPDYADCLAAWLDAIGIERPHVLGLSWGSTLALELYSRHPHLLASLILASAYAGWAGSLPPEVVAERLEASLREVNLPPEQVIARWLPTLLPSTAPADLVDEIVSIMTDNVGMYHPAGYRAMFHAMAEADLRDVLPRIQVPTLLLYGEDDQRSPLSVARELHRGIPGVQLIVMPGVGHLCHIEAPDDFNAHVRHFIRSIAQG